MAIPGVLDLHGNVVHVEMIDDLLGEIVRQSTNPAFKDVVASFPEVTHSKLNGQRVYTDFNSTDTCHKSWKRALEVENRLGERCRPVCVYVTSDGVSCTSTSISAWQCGFLQAPPRLRHKVGGHPALQLIAIPDTLDGVGQTNTANKQLISNEALRLVLQKFVDVGDGCIVNNYPGEEGPVRIIPYLEVHSADYSEIVS